MDLVVSLFFYHPLDIEFVFGKATELLFVHETSAYAVVGEVRFSFCRIVCICFPIGKSKH